MSTRSFSIAFLGSSLVSAYWNGAWEPGEECLVYRDGDEVIAQLSGLDPHRSRQIGKEARRRVLLEHTYARRGAQVEAIFRETYGGL